MHTQQTAYVNTQSLWVKVYGLDSYPITKQTLYLGLQHWNHSGCLSLLPYSSSSFVVVVATEREFYTPCFTLTGDVVLWALSTGWPAQQLCDANTCLNILFRLTFTLVSQAIQGQMKSCKKKPKQTNNTKNPPPTDHFRLFLFYWLTI